MKEFIKEEIKIIADKINFLRNVLLALMSGIIGVLFGITQNKIILNTTLLALLTIAIILVIFIVIRINIIEEERKILINQLKEMV